MMPLSVALIVIILALLLTILAGLGKAPLWIPVLLITLAMLLQLLPAR